MSKALEKVPETLAELKAALPELAAAAFEEGARSIDAKSLADKAVTTERERVLGLASIQFGEDAGGKFKALVESGISVEAFKAVRALEPGEGKAEAKGQDAEAAKKQEILDALKQSGAPKVGADDAAAALAGKDYLTLVDEYRAAHKCGATEAMQAITKEYPGKHKEYIRKVNEIDKRRAV